MRPIFVTETPNTFRLQFDYNPKMIDVVKRIPSKPRWDATDKAWIVQKSHLSYPPGRDARWYVFALAQWAVKCHYCSDVKTRNDEKDITYELPTLTGIDGDHYMLLDPYKYQLEGVQYALQHKRCIFGDQPGLGKTLQAICAVVKAHKEAETYGDSSPTLIICPASLKINWQREFKKFAGKNAIILDDSNRDNWQCFLDMRRGDGEPLCDVFITNYESLKKFFVVDIKEHNKLTLRHIVFDERIKLFKSVIIDESHKCKSSKTQQSKFVEGICRGKKWVFELTGTPVVNNNTDLIQQLKILDRLEDFGGYRKFVARYCDGPKQSSNMKELNWRLWNCCFFRREKKAVLTQLPDKSRQYIECDITNRREYDDAERDVISYLRQYKNANDDKIILNQPLLDLIGVEGVDYTVIENMKFSTWNGNITTATGNYLILVTMKNGVISHKGLPISGYHGWWTADVKPSTSDPTVDEDGNAVTYTKNYYNNGTRSNVAVAKPYLLFDAGTDVSNFVMAFLAFIPSSIYDVKSVNDGIRIVSSSIDGVGNKTLELLQKGIATKTNSLDTNCVIGGMKFDVESPFKLLADANSSIYLQPIPSGAQNVVVRGLQGTSGITYHRVFILNESLTIIANDNIYGTAVVNQYVSLENVTGAKYLAFNASGTNVANDINDVVVLYDAPKDYPRWIAYHNNFADETPILDVPFEFAGQKNYLCYEYVKSTNGQNWEIEIPDITERFFTFIMPDSAFVTNADTFIQYDANGNLLKSEAWNNVKGVNFGKNSKCYKQVRLEQGCAKIYIYVTFDLAFNNTSLEEMVARGNKLLLNNRIIEWGNNQMSSVNGLSLNIKAKAPLDGKLICCMGDSITDFGSTSTDGSYAWYIQKKFDCGVANYGVGSAHFCDVANTDPTTDTEPTEGSTINYPNNVVSTQVRWCIREMTEDNITPDAIILSGLTNDAYGTVNLGDLQTSLDAYPMTADAVHTDFYGAAVYMVSKLRTAFPSAKIFFATPPRSLNPTQMQRLVQYVEAMRNVAKALGCGVIDFFDESLVEYPKATYHASTETWTHDNPMYNTNDVLHPSQLGVNKMGQLASAKLSEYLQ